MHGLNTYIDAKACVCFSLKFTYGEYLALIIFLSTDLTLSAICADSDSFVVGAIDPWSRQDMINKRKLLSVSPC